MNGITCPECGSQRVKVKVVRQRLRRRVVIACKPCDRDRLPRLPPRWTRKPSRWCPSCLIAFRWRWLMKLHRWRTPRCQPTRRWSS